METLLRELAAGLAVFAAAAHSLIGERAVFPVLRIEPVRFARLIRAIWHCLSAGWLCGAALLLFPDRWAGLAVAMLFASAALGNAIGTRGRHFGWAVLAAAGLLTLAVR